jgi:twitching motility protein PilT
VVNLLLEDLLVRVLELDGSDLHLTVGVEPSVRIRGELKRLTEFPVMTSADTRKLIYDILSTRQIELFEETSEIDVAHSIPGVGRFRANVFRQRDSVGAVLRSIPHDITPLSELGVPQAISGFAELHRGLVLVAGPTGSGKSTTLAGLIDEINRTRPVHIMTIEDPIEFLHRHQLAVVNQRELGGDTNSYAVALKQALRQDPDVILVGELRELEAIQCALTAASTGHLVFASLHTQSAAQTIEHIIDAFPEHQQVQARTQLAATLQGVVTQQLVPAADGQRRLCAAEVLVMSGPVRGLVREGKTHQIPSVIQAGGRYGMQSMDQALTGLVKSGDVFASTAEEFCVDHELFHRMVSGT